MLISRDFIKGNLLSIYEIGKYLITLKRPKVIFVAPQHFNRNAKKQNPYFEKFIVSCEINNIPYIKIESPEYGGFQPHDCSSIRIDILFWLMMLLRKIFIKMQGRDDRMVDQKVAKIINAITFGRFKAPCYITMAGLFIEMFQEMCPKSTVCDLQHGIIYQGHPGYFDDKGDLAESLDAPNCKLLVWGERIRQFFVENCKNNDIIEKVIVVGYPLNAPVAKKDCKANKTIVISLQFTYSLTERQRNDMRDMLDEVLAIIDRQNFIIKLKHHPRFNNSIDLAKVLERHPKAEITNQTLDELADETFLHITWSSTTVFEFASYGIPSFIISDKRYPLGENIYYDQFGYPLFYGIPLDEAISDLMHNRKVLTNEITKWYSSIYATFDEDLILSLMKKGSI